MIKLSIACIVLVVTIALQPAIAQQRADLEFQYPLDQPAFAQGRGPTVAIDAGHHNFHTADGRYAPFAKLVSDDGFKVTTISSAFDASTLKGVDVLVIANALNAINDNRWILPTPSAFTEAEIEAIRIWIEAGGSLLLIADHMPFGGAAEDLARAFEFEFVNGYAAKVDTRTMKFTFVPGQGLDIEPVGDFGLPPTTQFVTFTGQAFKIPAAARSILTLVGDHVAFLPTIAGQFDQSTPVVNVTGYSQGAVREFGNGRIAVFGEAAAFSAQLSRRGGRMGMNAAGADENAPFVLKILRWLARYQPSP